MISIGFQFDYELNSKKSLQKNHKTFWFFFDFFRFFWIFFDLFLIVLGFFWIFLDFFDFNWISIGFFLKVDFFDFFGFFSISIGFQLDFFGISIGFQLDFFMSVGEATSLRKKNKKIEKNQKPNPKSFFFDFNWFNYKIQSNWNPKKSEKNRKKIRGKYFFCLLHNSQS